MDPRFSPPADGGRPQNALTGQLFDGQLRHHRHHRARPIQQAAVLAQHRPWPAWRPASPPRSMPVPARWAMSGTWTPTTGSGPPGLMDMSATTDTSAEVFTDYGSTTQLNSTATHHLTCTVRPAARWCSAPGRCNGHGAWTMAAGPATGGGNSRPDHAAGDGEPVRRHGCCSPPR